ncbi:MAG: hypothetical protein QNI96_05430 [Woeseiaceae bacterium]|nr:hypothetical protein [Woeseiaceae bacterium]
MLEDNAVADDLEKPGYVEHDLNHSLPQRESLVRSFLIPEDYEDWKEELFREKTLKLSLSYQANSMRASNVVMGKDYAAAGFLLFEAQWTPFNFDEDYEGGLVFTYNNVHTLGSAAQPPLFFFNTGSMFVHDALFLDVDPFVANLYWEQWLKKDRFQIRVGQHVPVAVIDFSRFADVRTSVTNPTIGFPANVIPFGPPAMGLTAKLTPPSPTGFYATGHVSDINSRVDELNVGNIFDTGDVFVAGEFGYNWARMGADGPELDHVHLLVFRADRASEKFFPTTSGWGFKLAGEKQFGKWVTLLNYAYNTASGGGFGYTSLQHVVNVGAAYTQPFGIKGEAFVALTWGKELDEGQCGVVPCFGRDQTMLETYYKVLLTPNMWITPGLQVHFDPVNNPETDAIWVPMLKFRVFF